MFLPIRNKAEGADEGSGSLENGPRGGVCSHMCVLACYYLRTCYMRWLYLTLASVTLNFRPLQSCRSAISIKTYKRERKRAIVWLRPHGVLNFDL